MKRPEILYKYRSLDPSSRQYTLRAISHQEVWFSSLSQFNDPFEARVLVSMDGDDGAWRREFGYPRPSSDKCRTMIPELDQGVRDDAEQIGMFCLATKPDDILLWSHYADSHRGLCIGFRIAGDSILLDAQPVEYSSDYPVIDYFRMTREQRVRAMLLRKALHWESEQEWRALRTGPPPGLSNYPAGMLASVILGCQISVADREAVVQAAEAVPVPVDLYQAQRRESDYALDLIHLEGSAPSNPAWHLTAGGDSPGGRR